MKITACILSTLVTLCLASGCKTTGSAAPVKSVEVRPLFKPEAATLAQQKMCAEQAEKRYQADRYGDFEKKDDLPLTSYTNHYDPAVNVCYVRIDSFGGAAGLGSVSSIVYDAFGGRVYATYMWSNPLKKKYWEVSPSECQIDIPGKPQEKCASEDDFDERTEKYFGVTKD